MDLRHVKHQFDSNLRFICSVPIGGRLLDLGCGNGRLCSKVRRIRPDIELHGLDLLKHAELPAFVQWIGHDLNEGTIPFDDSRFDAIVLSHVVEHLDAPAKIGPEITRVLKPGGRVYVETPNWIAILMPSWGLSREERVPFNFYDDGTHLRPWTRQKLYEFLRFSCDMGTVKVRAVRNFPQLILDPLIVCYALTTGNRRLLAASINNVVGWSIYGVASHKNPDSLGDAEPQP